MEEGLEFRELSLDMYDKGKVIDSHFHLMSFSKLKGYMELLGELTVVGNISKAQFSGIERQDRMHSYSFLSNSKKHDSLR